MLNKPYHAIIKFISQQWGLKCYLASAILLMSLLFFLLNMIWFHYSGVSYTLPILVHTFPGGLLLYIVAIQIRDIAPRTGFFLESLWALLVISLIMGVFATAIQFTPFPHEDKLFYQWDKTLNFNVLSIMTWAHHHDWVISWATFIYNSLNYQLLLAPLILAALNQRHAVNVFFTTVLIAAIIACTIYYFIPSTDPASVLHSRYFTHAEHIVVERFIRLHHHLAVHSPLGGLIGFPSFHVIWVVAVTYGFKRYPTIFAALAFWNGLLILSTLVLGWHFLVDLMGGFVVVAVATYLAEKSQLLLQRREVWPTSNLNSRVNSN